MDISILRECVDLADTLNFTKTARRFYVSQPTLSNHITNLENEIGAQIVQRSKNGLALTKAGKVFVQGAEKMLREYDRVLAEVSLVQSGKDEVVRFGCLDCAVETFLAPALHAFARAHPSTPVLYSSYQVHEVLKALDANEIDVAVTTAFFAPDPVIYATEPLYRDELCFVVPKTHPLAQRASVGIDELAGEDLLLPERGVVPHEGSMFEDILEPVRGSVSVRERFKSIYDLRMLLSVENCGTIMFSHVRHYIGSDRVAFVPLETGFDDFSVSVVWKRSNETQVICDLARCFKEECARQGMA